MDLASSELKTTTHHTVFRSSQLYNVSFANQFNFTCTCLEPSFRASKHHHQLHTTPEVHNSPLETPAPAPGAQPPSMGAVPSSFERLKPITPDYYSNLNLRQTATKRQITQSYRELALIHHPDKGGDPTSFHKASVQFVALGLWNLLTNELMLTDVANRLMTPSNSC